MWNGRYRFVAARIFLLSFLSLTLAQITACGGGSEAPPTSLATAAPVDLLPSAIGPLSITGQPEIVAMAFGFYEFIPGAVHTGGQQLSFAIENKPVWAEFNVFTGVLSGIPEFENTGIHPQILISATDGQRTVALKPFSIDVFIPELTGVTLSWVPPVTRMDGSALENLDGFTIHYGTDPFRLPHVIRVDSPNTNTLFIDSIPAGRTYYFGVRALDAFKNESRYSTIVQIAL